MTASGAVIKATAKTTLRGRMLRSVFASLIFLFTVFILLSVSSLIAYLSYSGLAAAITFAVLFIPLGFPLLLGLLRFFWRMCWEQEDSAIGVFRYFSDKTIYLRALRFSMKIAFRVVGIGLLTFAPALIVDLFSSNTIYNFLQIEMPDFVSNLWILSAFFRFGAVILLAIILLRGYLAPFLFVADDAMDPDEALHRSVVISRGTSFDFVMLIAGFILWILLSLLVIPLVFTLPYFLTSYLVHCRFATAQYNLAASQSQKPNSASPFPAGI